MSEEVPATYTPPHETNLFAFLFCRDVIEEGDNTITPFRLVELAQFQVAPNGVFVPFDLNVFVGVGCENTSLHDHSLTLRVTDPNGADAGNATIAANFGPDAFVSYRNVHLFLQSKFPGSFLFEVYLDGKLAGARKFYIKHVPQQAQSETAEKSVG